MQILAGRSIAWPSVSRLPWRARRACARGPASTLPEGHGQLPQLADVVGREATLGPIEPGGVEAAVAQQAGTSSPSAANMSSTPRARRPSWCAAGPRAAQGRANSGAGVSEVTGLARLR